jgi:hypothetical protein
LLCFSFCCIVVILLLLTYFLAIWKVTIVMFYFLLYCCYCLIVDIFLAVWKVTIVMFLLYCCYSLIVDIFSRRLESGNCYNSKAVNETTTITFGNSMHCCTVHLQSGVTLTACTLISVVEHITTVCRQRFYRRTGGIVTSSQLSWLLFCRLRT